MFSTHPSAPVSPVGEQKRFSPAYAIALTLLIGGFLLVGGARDDLLSLLIWRPLSALLALISLAFYGGAAWRQGKPLVLFGLAVLATVGIQLLPLPPAVWTSLPGHEINAASFRLAGLALPWQPLSIAPIRTWNALFSLVAPLGLLLIAIVLPQRGHRKLLLLFLVIGFASGIIGLIQAVGPSNGPLYFYRITNNGTSVGLFANRNHQAAFLASLLPLLAAHLSLFRGKPDKLVFERSLTLALAALLIPLILMTGSRTGIALGVVACALSWFWVYRAPRATGRIVGIRSDHRSRLVGLAVGLVLVVGIIIVVIRTPALGRLLETDPATELRIEAMPTVIEVTKKYMPLGSGFGTFVEAYQISEPDKLISARYFNHAHSDLLEIVLTGGVAGAALMVVAAIMSGLAAIKLWRRRDIRRDHPDFVAQVFGRTGLSVLAILALASATDYPVRVPSIMLYVVVMSVWVWRAVHKPVAEQNEN